ncbi:hypothetical protein [Pseudoalteromonas maricaloris]
MTRSLLTVSVLSSLYSSLSVAEQSIETIDVHGTRAPLYSTRDVNASALGMKIRSFFLFPFNHFLKN